MNKAKIINKSIALEDLTIDEALFLYNNFNLQELSIIANNIRFKKHPTKNVSWIIDRNINITNVCISQCLFCNFCRKPNNVDSYITTIEEYKEKIKELIEIGGNQILLQGGFNPKLDLEYYEQLFKELKNVFPILKLHALGPPEIVFLSKKSGISNKEVLARLQKAGLDSLPGAGAEILVDRVRSIVSPAKCSSQEWLSVMLDAFKLGMTTTATMMFGHLETIEERIMHILSIRDTQKLKPQNSKGFIAFIAWPFQSKNTRLNERYKIDNQVNSSEYIKMVAISRILLNNIDNIQASWLTVGNNTAKICLHAGANDLGSIMIEENVAASAGISNKLSKDDMERLIIDAGFTPVRRNQQYELMLIDRIDNN